MTNFEALLRLLTRNEVEFVVIGGAAAIIHGSARLTQDLDILYRRSDANLGRLASALASIRPYLRGAAPGLPFVWDKTTLARGLNFTLVTELGDLDLFGEIPGGGDYDAVAGEAIAVEIFGSRSRC